MYATKVSSDWHVRSFSHESSQQELVGSRMSIAAASASLKQQGVQRRCQCITRIVAACGEDCLFGELWSDLGRFGKECLSRLSLQQQNVIVAAWQGVLQQQDVIVAVRLHGAFKLNSNQGLPRPPRLLCLCLQTSCRRASQSFQPTYWADHLR